MSAAFMSAIAKEIAEEKAQGLGRVERLMLAALEQYLSATERAPPGERESHEVDELVWRLTAAVTSFVIQREACGLTDTHRLLKVYGIPAEIVARLGARRRAEPAAC